MHECHSDQAKCVSQTAIDVAAGLFDDLTGTSLLKKLAAGERIAFIVNNRLRWSPGFRRSHLRMQAARRRQEKRDQR